MRVMAFDLGHMDALSESVAAFRLDERSTAVVPCYSSHVLTPLDDSEQVRAFAAEHPEGQLLIGENKLELLDADIRARN